MVIFYFYRSRSDELSRPFRNERDEFSMFLTTAAIFIFIDSPVALHLNRWRVLRQLFTIVPRCLRYCR